MILYETKVKDRCMTILLRRWNMNNFCYVPPVGLAGGFCVAWDYCVDFEIVCSDKNLLVQRITRTWCLLKH